MAKLKTEVDVTVIRVELVDGIDRRYCCTTCARAVLQRWRNQVPISRRRWFQIHPGGKFHVQNTLTELVICGRTDR